MWPRWVSTVFTLMDRVAATSLFEQPQITKSKTSRSRGDNEASFLPSSASSRAPAWRRANGHTGRTGSPFRMRSMVAASSCAGMVLGRKPLAPAAKTCRIASGAASRLITTTRIEGAKSFSLAIRSTALVGWTARSVTTRSGFRPAMRFGSAEAWSSRISRSGRRPDRTAQSPIRNTSEASSRISFIDNTLRNHEPHRVAAAHHRKRRADHPSAAAPWSSSRACTFRTVPLATVQDSYNPWRRS